jgi:hypothetical protein
MSNGSLDAETRDQYEALDECGIEEEREEPAEAVAVTGNVRLESAP